MCTGWGQTPGTRGTQKAGCFQTQNPHRFAMIVVDDSSAHPAQAHQGTPGLVIVDGTPGAIGGSRGVSPLARFRANKKTALALTYNRLKKGVIPKYSP